MCVHSKTELRWNTVGLWVLAACASRSTRSKGSQQTLRLSHPVRVARKQSKAGRFSRRGWWPFAQAHLSGEGQGTGTRRPPKPPGSFWRLMGPPPRTGPGSCQPWGPRPFGGSPQTPPSTDQNDINSEGFGVLLYCRTARGQQRGWVTAGLVFRKTLPPSPF